MKVSVIIPVRDSELYLEGCIRNLEGQSFRDFETIFVIDSRSSDGSESFLKSLDPSRYRTVVQEDDTMVSGARNIGFTEAQGGYIWFLDVDDTPHPEFLKTMVGLLESEGADFVACNFVYNHPGTEPPKAPAHVRVDSYSGIEALVAMNNGRLSANVWDKLFKSSLIRENSIRFERGYSEDYHFVSAACIASSKVAYTSRPLYLYNLNKSSRSWHRGDDIARKDVEIFESFLPVVKESSPDRYAEFCNASVRHLMRSMTVASKEVFMELVRRESIQGSLRYCRHSGAEMLTFRLWPSLYYRVGRHCRDRRYSRGSFLFDPS